MSLPKRFTTGNRYLGSSAFHTPITIQNPDTGQNADGSKIAPAFVASTRANVAQWRGKETDKTEERVGISSYKIIIHYPKNYVVATGMQILVRNQTHNIESFSDPDGQRVELHIWTSVTGDVTQWP
jgi:SPP1 family predicted phage head-tail adaptor